MFNIYGTRIDVRVGDPLTFAADGLVIPANDHLWMGSGISGQVKRAGGEAIEVAAVQQGPAELGTAVATDAGELSYRKVFHAVISGQDLKTRHDRIGPAVTQALAAAREAKLASLVIAPLESEEAIGAFHDAARELVHCLLGSLGEKTSLKEIVLAATGSETRDAYRRAFLVGLRGE